jgi:NTE family protein
MTIPLYFEAIFLDSTGHVLQSRKEMDSNTMILVDGGLGLNYPIHLFDTLVRHNPHSVYQPNPHTLGIKFDDDQQIDYNIRGKGLAPMRIRKVTEFIGAFYNVSFEEINRSTMSITDWERTIFIPTDGFSPRIRRLKQAEKQFLLNRASEATAKYLNGK